MTEIRRGFVIYDEATGRVRVDASATVSLVSNAHLLAVVTEAAKEARGLLLDIGCGVKPYLDILGPKVERYVGVDWPGSLHGGGEVDVFCTNLTLPFADEGFDTVLCTEVIEHSPMPWLAMSEIERVLRPGGALILTAPFCYIVHEEPHDYFRYTSVGLRSLAERAGLSVSYVKPVGGAMSVLTDLFSKVLAGIGAVRLSKLFQRAYLAVAGLLSSSSGAGESAAFMSDKLCHGHIMLAVKPGGSRT